MRQHRTQLLQRHRPQRFGLGESCVQLDGDFEFGDIFRSAMSSLELLEEFERADDGSVLPAFYAHPLTIPWASMRFDIYQPRKERGESAWRAI